MLRLFNIACVVILLATSIYAYSVKYQTVFYAEQIVKLKHKIDRETDKIAELRASWAELIKPQRVGDLSDKFLDLQPLNLNQIANFSDLPERGANTDSIGHKLEQLGLAGAQTQAIPASVTTPTRALPSNVTNFVHKDEPSQPSQTRMRSQPALSTTTPHQGL